MTRFLGGPYDDRDLPIDPIVKQIRLPREDDLPDFLNRTAADPGLTGAHGWPYAYELDESESPPVYRFRKGR